MLASSGFFLRHDVHDSKSIASIRLFKDKPPIISSIIVDDLCNVLVSYETKV